MEVCEWKEARCKREKGQVLVERVQLGSGHTMSLRCSGQHSLTFLSRHRSVKTTVLGLVRTYVVKSTRGNELELFALLEEDNTEEGCGDDKDDLATMLNFEETVTISGLKYYGSIESTLSTSDCESSDNNLDYNLESGEDGISFDSDSDDIDLNLESDCDYDVNGSIDLGRPPELFSGSEFSGNEFSIALLSIIHKHSLTYASVDDLLKLLSHSFPCPNAIPSTQYLLTSVIKYNKHIVVHLCCSYCDNSF